MSHKRRAAIVVSACAAAVVVTVAVALVVAMSPVRQASTSGSDAAAHLAANSTAACPATTVTVSTAAALKKALKAAAAGTSIRLADGTYSGRFTLTGQGTAARPIALCGSAKAVLDGGETSKGYVVHLTEASHWLLSGFSVRNGQKGVVADATTYSVIRGLAVSNIGDEGIHLRNFSTHNTVAGNTVSGTGQHKAKFGEGIYIGSAESNWKSVSGGKPDASDDNVVQGNTISNTTSESVDIKEGTTGGKLSGNTFNGSSITGADSWVDVKGNGWLIEGNTGTDSPKDGFQTHEILDGWGTDNTFSSNSAKVNGPGYGYSLTPTLDNVVECSNTASGADKGTSNVTCSDD